MYYGKFQLYKFTCIINIPEAVEWLSAFVYQHHLSLFLYPCHAPFWVWFVPWLVVAAAL